MRSVFLFDMITVDGFFEGPNADISWHNVDDEFNEFAIQQLDEIGTLLFGRVTYEMMASYWPTPAAVKDDPIVAGKMNAMPKVVFSRTLPSASWQNTRLVKTNPADEVAALKQQPGKDIAIFGSSDLAVALMRNGLLDELRLMVNPIVLSRGKPILHGLDEQYKLRLIKSRTFRSGNVLLYYEPAAQS